MDDYDDGDGQGEHDGHWVDCHWKKLWLELMKTPREVAHAAEVNALRRCIGALEDEVKRRKTPQTSALLDAFARTQERDSEDWVMETWINGHR